jgi:hypothetical protein
MQMAREREKVRDKERERANGRRSSMKPRRGGDFGTCR